MLPVFLQFHFVYLEVRMYKCRVIEVKIEGKEESEENKEVVRCDW